MHEDEPIQPLNNSEKVNEAYPYWRNRIMYTMISGYAVFYFVRKNMSVANPLIREEFGIGTEEMGAALGISAIIYGIAKFLSGLLADTLSPRYIMGLGLLMSAIVSICLGLVSENISNAIGLSTVSLFALLWCLNNVFQGMGQPPCSRLLTQWFSPSEIGKQWGIWNMSHHIGAAVILSAGAYLVVIFGTWRAVFIAPALLAFLYAIFLINRLKDRPEAVGLPPVEIYKKDIDGERVTEFEEKFEDTKETKREIFVKYILFNKLVWIVSLVNLFVYIVRIGILDWAPSFLKESRGLSLTESAITTSVFEIAGIIGAIAAGWLSDTVFHGRRGRTSVIFMGLLVISVFAILYIPSNDPYLMSAVLFAVGFFVHGPMLLVAVAAADFATKKAAATAVGLTGLFGYIGAFMANYGTGLIAERWGWDYVIYFYLVSALMGMSLLLTTWNSRSRVLDDYHD